MGEDDSDVDNYHTGDEYSSDNETGKEGGHSFWKEAEEEEFLQRYCIGLFKRERQVYNKLKDLPGKCIPRLLAAVQLAIHAYDVTEQLLDRPSIQGALLEYIEGFTLKEIEEHVPSSHWQEICNWVIANMRSVSDHGILNFDVHPSQFVVKRVQSAGVAGFQVFQLDFAQCGLRSSRHDRELWRCELLRYDKEGYLGEMMQRRLGGKFVYNRPEWYSETIKNLEKMARVQRQQAWADCCRRFVYTAATALLLLWCYAVWRVVAFAMKEN
jgi:hypothetical protein